MVIDVETTNNLENPLVYDFGYAITDKQGNIYEKGWFVIGDVFFDEKELMTSAYYANKLPLYYKALAKKEIKVINIYNLRKKVKELTEKYNIKEFMAYNANFDRNALNNTIRYITKSKCRWFFPYGIKWNCIWNMACQTICKQKGFAKFTIENDFVSPKGNLQTSAEIVYRYINKDVDFSEDHLGLSDVLIEIEIMAKSFAQHKKIKKGINRFCWRIPSVYHFA